MIAGPEVPGYEIEALIGRGGFSTVYRGYQPRLNRHVAIKVVHSNEIDHRSQDRFERECRAIGSLSGHPNVVTVYEVGALAEGDPFIAMEYLEAGSLQSMLQNQGPLSWPDVVAVGRAVSAALDAAHGLGILHRDLKPGNVMCTPYGSYKLGDFGIAGLVDSATNTLNATAATIAYAAPEILKGSAASVASDLYGLGATMFTLLKGVAPFSGEADESALALILRATGDPVPAIERGIAPPLLASLVGQLMAKDPEERPASAAEVTKILQALGTDAGTHPGRPGSGTTDAPPPDASADMATSRSVTPVRHAEIPTVETEADSSDRRSIEGKDDGEATPAPDLTVVLRSSATRNATAAPPARDSTTPRTGPEPRPRPDLRIGQATPVRAETPDGPQRGRRIGTKAVALGLVLAVLACAVAIAYLAVDRRNWYLSTAAPYEGGSEVVVIKQGSPSGPFAFDAHTVGRTDLELPSLNAEARATVTTHRRFGSLEDAERAIATGRLAGHTGTTPPDGIPTSTDVGGTWRARFVPVSCEGFDDCTAPIDAVPTFTLSCEAIGCTFVGDGPVGATVAAPLEHDGIDLVGSDTGLTSNVSCKGTTPKPSTVDVTLRPAAAVFEDGAWRATALTGTIIRAEEAQDSCGPSSRKWLLAAVKDGSGG